MRTQPIQRNTKQRQVILEELRKLTSHPTAATLYGLVRLRLPKISLGTVYRNLELLARLGVIQKLDYSGVEARYDGNAAHHDHLRCVECGCVDDVSVATLDLSGGATNHWNGYEIFGYRLEFFGVCPRCRCRRIDPDSLRESDPSDPSQDVSQTSLKNFPKPR